MGIRQPCLRRSLGMMMKEMPDRAFDGIAEQHAVTFSADWLLRNGALCNIYSSFMQRAYDQVVHDVALQNLNVVFCLDRGGLAGADGPTHHGVYDMAYFRCIPNGSVCTHEWARTKKPHVLTQITKGHFLYVP